MSDSDWFVLRAEPSSGSSKSGSPDIILGGETPDPSFTAQYDAAFNATGDFDATNYVYVRAKNDAAAQSIGTIMVYAVRQNNVQNQGSWVALKTTDGRNSTNIAADAGSVGVNGAPLLWEPDGAPPPGTAPWMLIAEIIGDGYPAIKLPITVKDLASFNGWIADQSRIAALVVQEAHVTPTEIPSFTWSRQVTFNNADPITLSASVTCTGGTPGGKLAYQFDKNDADGLPIGVGTTPYQVNAIYSQSRTVAVGFTSTLTITYTPPADETANAQFAVQVATETTDGDDGDLGDTTRTLFINDTLDFGQARGKV